jgi:hypothetical protein
MRYLSFAPLSWEIGELVFPQTETNPIIRVLMHIPLVTNAAVATLLMAANLADMLTR